MPVSFEHLVIYGIVLVVLFFLGRRFVCSLRSSGKCSKNCSCGKGEIRRDPVITNYLKKHD
ncbi:hypothetical protein G0Q06_12275 [Puniceicoccales bacterium CK1056]|uniref:FeoB-associated Cys-rich membrane protein n=1 Tax=Oceanipulchritudo coccoides TaxID=2706888 RepID=A0A6B2M3A4_9BACT|nr:hypothetical protein [Oceanipulchritudo coccoides]NDV63233.1 hypothetical protein [Oceanipulchritudo coccoides]